MCEGASKQTPDLKILPRQDRTPPPRFEIHPPLIVMVNTDGKYQNVKLGGLAMLLQLVLAIWIVFDKKQIITNRDLYTNRSLLQSTNNNY